MDDYTEAELISLRVKTVEQLRKSRLCTEILKQENPAQSDLRLLTLRQTGNLLLGIDLIDARLLDLRQRYITPVWIPRI